MNRCFVIALVFCSTILYGQVDSVKTDDPLNQQIELLSENLEQEDADYTNLIEDLQYYKAHPINLNAATREELRELGLLSEIQIGGIIAYRERFGNFVSIYEIQAVPELDLGTIYSILPYVRVSDRLDAAHFNAKEMFKNGKHEIVFRTQRIIEQQEGFAPIDSAELAENPNKRYLGNPYRMFMRYRFTYSNFVSWGMTAEKDAGEEFFRGTQKQGFDFYSAHVSVRNFGVVKAAVLGDYQVSFGQGLVAWTGYAFGKTAMSVATKRNAIGLRPYTSVDENRFLRGGATTLRFGKIETTAFYSVKKRDANITATDTLQNDIEVLEVSSLQLSGLHTTLAELADKDVITEHYMGGNISFRNQKFSIGVTGAHSRYSAALRRDLDLYNQFEFSSDRNTVVGADYSFLIRNFHFFGEAARSASGGMAFVNGVLISLDPRLAFTLHHRHFDRNFQNLYANTFSENTFPLNERGIYMGIQAKPAKKITLTAYYDQVKFPWMRYNADAPSNFQDVLIQLNFTPDKKTDFYIRYRNRDRWVNASDPDADIDFIVPLDQQNIRFQATYPLGPSLRLRNRIEYLIYHQANEERSTGFVMWQDLTYKKLGSPIAITLRYALFQTESYDARIYAYENDMPYAFSVPAYYYKGSRAYVLINWDVTRRVELWLRVAQFFYYDRNVISEGGMTEIQGNTKSEVKLQMRIKL